MNNRLFYFIMVAVKSKFEGLAATSAALQQDNDDQGFKLYKIGYSKNI